MVDAGSARSNARGQPQNRSRGKGRGGGSAGRGAPSSKLIDLTNDSTTDHRNTFERERLENVAKRAQRENSSISRGRGGGNLRGRGKAHINTKQVRFADSTITDSPTVVSPTEDKMNPFGAPSTAPRNPFDTAKMPVSAFGAPSAPAVNPFASKQDAPKPNPFGAPSQATITPNSSIFGAPSTTPNGTPPRNPFGAPSQPSSTKPDTSVFGKPSSASNGGTLNGTPPAAFGAPSAKSASNPFGMPSGASNGDSAKPANNPFGKPSSGGTPNGTPPPTFGAPPAESANNLFGKPSASIFGATSATSSPFGATSNSSTAAETKPASKPAHSPFATASKPLPASSQTGLGTSNGFGSSKPSSLLSSSSTPNNAFSKTATNGSAQKALFSNPPVQVTPASTNVDSSAFARGIYETLRKDRVIAPTWPQPSPSDPKFKSAIEVYWKASKPYRNEVRVSLIRAGQFDDPNKPKRLDEAIDFKGICETMCPDFEMATRIYERDWKVEETENNFVAPHKMIKAMARSAAGQDAPLPMDVRSPGCLRRTLDYLLKSVLGDDEDNLPEVHLFLWDRTRAIRRDFVFQLNSMNSNEMLDYVYCLERTARFHVISLHQMSKEGVAAKEFSEQQEVEQLSKSLISLMQSYTDCRSQGITCENESEFRAYHAILNARDPGMLQAISNWGFNVFRDSEEIQIAICLVEALQNVWDPRGPLLPQTATDIAPNAFAKFFTILEDKQVSYTMACFAEIHFNIVRKSIFKTILTSYRKQRDQTKDWTLSKLNAFLRFDDENDIIDFGEKYGLRFDEVDGEDILSFESDEGIKDPHPPAKHAHSYSLVECKRGSHTLPEAIDKNVFDETSEAEVSEEEQGLFVTDEKTQPKAPVLPKIANVPTTTTATTAPKFPSFSTSTISSTEATKVDAATPPASILNNGMSSPKPLGDLFSQKAPTSPAGNVSEVPSGTTSKPSSFFPMPVGSTSSTASTPSSSFPNPLESTPSTTSKPSSFFPKPLDSPGTSANSQSKLTPSVSTFNMNSDVTGKESPKPTTTTKPPSVFDFTGPKPTTPSTGNAPTPPRFGSTLTGAAPQSAPQSAPQTESPKAPSFFPAPPKPTTSSVTGPGSSSQIAGQKRFPPLGQTQAFTPKVSSPLSLPAQVPPKETPSSVFQPSVTSKPSASPNFGLGTQEASPSNALSVVQKPHPYGREAQLTGLTNWMAFGEDGIIDQFVSYNVEEILMQAVQTFQKEEAQRKELQKDNSDRAEADAFRYRFIATKYFNQWRTAAYNLLLQRRGRQARRARVEEAKRKAALNIVDEFKATAKSGGTRLRESLDSMEDIGDIGSLIGATGILDGVHDRDKQLQSIIREEPFLNVKKRRRADKVSKPSSSSTHKRGKSDDPFRRTILSDPSYLAGGSRTLLMDKYDPAKDEKRRQVSGVQTDYFRLKARGILKPVNVTSLASSVAGAHLLKQKRSYEEFKYKKSAYEEFVREPTPKTLNSKRSYEAFDRLEIPETPPRSRSRYSSSMAQSVPAKAYLEPDFRLSIEGDEQTKALKRRAQAVMDNDLQPRRKRSYTDDNDEELFARAKRIREQMDEGQRWYQEETRRVSESRSRSVSGL